MQGKSTEILGRLKHGQGTAPRRRILILATSYGPLVGGAELAVKNLTDHLQDFSFDLVTSLPSLELSISERIGNVNVFRVGGSWGQTHLFLPKAFLPLYIFSKARSLLSRNSYDLIYVLQASQAGGAAWLLKTFTRVRIPIVLNLQEGKNLNQQSSYVRWSRSLIIQSADYFIAISNYLKGFLIEQGVSARDIFLIPNGVDSPRVANSSSESLREKLGLGNARVIMTVSRLVEKNGVEDLLEGFLSLRKNYNGPLKLVIIGWGDLESQLKDRTRALGLSADVVFVGNVDPGRVYEYLSIASIFIRPSYSEGLGTAFLEAMAAGVPIIGTRVGGIPDFLKDGETGIFCEVGDAENIGATMLRLLTDDPLRQKISQQGKELVLSRYTWEIIAQEFRVFYDTVMSQEKI